MKRRVVLAVLFCFAMTLHAADLTGTWMAAVVLDAGSGTATFHFQQTGDTFSGTYSGAVGEAKVAGTVKGDTAEWSFEAEQVGKVVYHGKLEGAAKITGTCEYGQLGKGTFTAEKK